MSKRPFVLDMETSDPDDFITLLFLLGHPEVDLRAVTISPGSAEQASIVTQTLQWFERRDVAVGVFGGAKPNTSHVSEWHYRTYPQLSRGPLKSDPEFEPGWQVLDRILTEDTTLVCGGPLKNLGELLRRRAERGQVERSLGTVFIQGGFAGEGVIPTDLQLDKFKGRTTCPSFNLGGDIPSAMLVLEHRHLFKDLRFVSKNVAHGVVYDESMGQHLFGVLSSRCRHSHVCDCPCHKSRDVLHIMPCCIPCDVCGENVPYLSPRLEGASALDVSQRLMYKGLGRYRDKGVPKKLHDPLAAACAIDPNIGKWAEVELYRAGGEWGSYQLPGSGIQLITGYDPEAFLRTFCRP